MFLSIQLEDTLVGIIYITKFMFYAAIQCCIIALIPLINRFIELFIFPVQTVFHFSLRFKTAWSRPPSGDIGVGTLSKGSSGYLTAASSNSEGHGGKATTVRWGD